MTRPSLFADYLGRGPTRARTTLGRDVVTVVLEETLTKAERRLAAEGEQESVITTRRVFQRTMREDLIAAVERVEPRLRFTGLDASLSLPGIELALEKGRLDAACALVPSPRRTVIAAPVGKPVYLVRHRLAARADDAVDVAGVPDLLRLNALVTSQRGSAFTDKLKAAGVRVDDATDDNGVNLRKMLAGHGRFAYMNELTLRRYLRTDNLEGRVRVLPVVLAEEPAYFWVSRKADPHIAQLLGDALDRIKASGEADRIYVRHAANP